MFIVRSTFIRWSGVTATRHTYCNSTVSSKYDTGLGRLVAGAEKEILDADRNTKEQACYHEKPHAHDSQVLFSAMSEKLTSICHMCISRSPADAARSARFRNPNDTVVLPPFRIHKEQDRSS